MVEEVEVVVVVGEVVEPHSKEVEEEVVVEVHIIEVVLELVHIV